MREFGNEFELKSVLLGIFGRAVGQENLVKKADLLKLLGSWNDNSPNFERRVRLAIVELRNDGHLILSTAADGGGYWLAKDWAEVLDFVEREYHAKALSMLETESIMKKSAQEKWGPIQVRMF